MQDLTLVLLLILKREKIADAKITSIVFISTLTCSTYQDGNGNSIVSEQQISKTVKLENNNTYLNQYKLVYCTSKVSR